MAERRLFKEYKLYTKNPPHNQNHQIVSLEPTGDEDNLDIFEWLAVISKPARSDSQFYYNGKWKLQIRLTSKYPLLPPTIRFITPINHPNIKFETGEICLDILKQDNWSPAWDLEHLVVAILMLLDDPEPDSPLNIDLANLYRHDKVAFESIVQYTIWKTQSFLLTTEDPMRTASSLDFTDNDNDLDPVREQVAKNVTKQVERLCSQSASPDPDEHSDPEKSEEARLKDETVEKVRQQFIKQVDDKVNEVRKKQEEYQLSRKRKH
ncbi:uncharacterized protein CANTADRAFT_316777 [Suhomyces tanzawaensis NRRL Y-17324]|uniref:UBC core domain-containing protein n=1 Tax=Suhomyces tanzawaensis NRRL Y-17324 TaxID=984487 RepID=A0A1E4SDT3_9ASCO|nr:uncharacterized protein CANTADRAFT_316777 [Suhomyces tanzawaensis NRRL Y-17324]ODV77643.1 hypothetical protein CANTADRAFT_316777 [Suhomyces tanzawaensis NRRL Y-17324]